jgi:hypothetical protein
MSSLDDKRVAASNKTNEILDARVVANYGDPGLDEDYHFDILSRFLIVKIEPCDRFMSKDKWVSMFAVVRRPEELWIKADGGIASAPANQQRSDTEGNINKGTSAAPAINSIPRLNKPYQLGDSIKIRRLSKGMDPTSDPIYRSVFPYLTAQQTYNAWHNQGAGLSYFASDASKAAGLRVKTIAPSSYAGLWNFTLTRSQYEALVLTINLSNAALYNSLQQIFAGAWSGNQTIYTANGGYLFAGTPYVTMPIISYEDMNYEQRSRSAATAGGNSCIPLVVTTPNSFPTPKTKTVGTVSYNPTYVVKS